MSRAQPNVGMRMNVKGLMFGKGENAPGVELPQFLIKPNMPQYEWYKRGRDSAFARAEQRVADIMKEDLKRYHSVRVGASSRAINAIRTKVMPATKSDMSPLGRKIWIGYQPTAAENADTPTERGVEKFMLTTIYGVKPGRIHPPWWNGGSWAKQRSTTGAIYGPVEYAQFPGGRLGYFAMTNKVFPPPAYITKAQRAPRGKKMLKEGFGARWAKEAYSPSSVTRKKPGRTPSTIATVRTWHPAPDIDHPLYDPGDRGKWKVTKVHWKASQVSGKYSMYHGKLVSNLALSGGKRHISKKTGKSVLTLPHGAEPFKKDLGKGGLNDKVWENAAKFMAAGLEKHGVKPKPVLWEWYNSSIVGGKLQSSIQSEYMDIIGNWIKYSTNMWKNHVKQVTQDQDITALGGIMGRGSKLYNRSTGKGLKSFNIGAPEGTLHL